MKFRKVNRIEYNGKVECVIKEKTANQLELQETKFHTFNHVKGRKFHTFTNLEIMFLVYLY